MQIDWAETKRRLGTHGRNAKRQLMPGWVVVAKLPVYKIKHQLAGWNDDDDDDELNINPPTPCLGKRPQRPKPKGHGRPWGQGAERSPWPTGAR